jgi:hypothetical protein
VIETFLENNASIVSARKGSRDRLFGEVDTGLCSEKTYKKKMEVEMLEFDRGLLSHPVSLAFADT